MPSPYADAPRVRGHALLRAARVVPQRFTDAGHRLYPEDAVPYGAGRPRCQCGELGPAGLSDPAAWQWYRDHRRQVAGLDD
jgi:hypothetical protein